MSQKVDPIADALHFTLASPNESDRNGEAANVVDGLYAIARALGELADAIDPGRRARREEARQLQQQQIERLRGGAQE